MSHTNGTYLRIDEPTEHVVLRTVQGDVDKVYGPFPTEHAAATAIELLVLAGIEGGLTTCPIREVEMNERPADDSGPRICDYRWGSSCYIDGNGAGHRCVTTVDDPHASREHVCACGNAAAVELPIPVPRVFCAHRWNEPPCEIKGRDSWHNCSRTDVTTCFAYGHLCFCGATRVAE